MTMWYLARWQAAQCSPKPIVSQDSVLGAARQSERKPAAVRLTETGLRVLRTHRSAPRTPCALSPGPPHTAQYLATMCRRVCPISICFVERIRDTPRVLGCTCECQSAPASRQHPGHRRGDHLRPKGHIECGHSSLANRGNKLIRVRKLQAQRGAPRRAPPTTASYSPGFAFTNV